MAQETTIEGLDDTIANLNREIRRIDQRSFAGLIKAGLFVKARSQEEAPVDQGTLLNSAFIYSFKTMKGYGVYVGYTAAYAVFVHENPRAGKTEGLSPSGNRYKTWAGAGKWKFLEDPVKNNVRTILEIIRQEAMIP